jgi:hypothetical protein
MCLHMPHRRYDAPNDVRSPQANVVRWFSRLPGDGGQVRTHRHRSRGDRHQGPDRHFGRGARAAPAFEPSGGCLGRRPRLRAQLGGGQEWCRGSSARASGFACWWSWGPRVDGHRRLPAWQGAGRLLPEFTPPVVDVQTESLGLSGAEAEQLITFPRPPSQGPASPTTSRPRRWLPRSTPGGRRCRRREPSGQRLLGAIAAAQVH